MSDIFLHVIDDPKAPERLRGLEVKAVLTTETLAFIVDMPDDPDPQELGYFRWFVGEITDKMMDILGPEKARLFTKSERTELTEAEKLALGETNVDGHNQGPY